MRKKKSLRLSSQLKSSRIQVSHPFQWPDVRRGRSNEQVGPEQQGERARGSPGSHWPEQATASPGSAWAEVPTITGARVGRGLSGARVWGRNPFWGRRVGRFPRPQGIGGERWGAVEIEEWAGELTGRPRRTSVDWVAQRETDQSCPGIGRGGLWRRGQHAREGARGSGRPACLPASPSPGRARWAGVGLLNAALEARRPSCPPRLEHPISLPPLPSAPAWGPGEGSGRDEEEGGFAECGRRGAKRALPLALPPLLLPPRPVPRPRGGRTMQADCRPPRWRAGRWWEPGTALNVS